MVLAGECVETEPSSFEEAVQQPNWVDPMVEEYESIVHNRNLVMCSLSTLVNPQVACT